MTKPPTAMEELGALRRHLGRLFPKGHGSLRGLGHVPPVTIAVSIEAWWSFSKPAMENGTEEDCCMTTTFLSSCVPK